MLAVGDIFKSENLQVKVMPEFYVLVWVIIYNLSAFSIGCNIFSQYLLFTNSKKSSCSTQRNSSSKKLKTLWQSSNSTIKTMMRTTSSSRYLIAGFFWLLIPSLESLSIRPDLSAI